MTARIVVAGTHSGVGKTTVATGLARALADRGHRVAGFKVGPDFIDPSYHALATGRPGRNLDPFLHTPELIAPLFGHGSSGCDVGVIEGVMGLFDGRSGHGELASTAHVAKLLAAPVLLVCDARAMARSVAALVHGFASYDPAVRLAGVVLNRVGSPTHERILRDALAPLGIPVVGVLRRSAQLASPERHLGLVPAREAGDRAGRVVAELGRAIGAGVDVVQVLDIARNAPPLRSARWEPETAAPGHRRVRIAMARGPVFTFTYPEHIELLEARGAELVAVDPTTDEALPEGTDLLYLGGGFPETHAELLASNVSLRQEINAFVRSGRPVVAECGGLLYLTRQLDGHPMCGVLDAEARMTGRLTLGYREAEAATDSVLAPAGTRVRGHEFHYSEIVPGAGTPPAWRMGGRTEGFVCGELHASYLHTHWASTPAVADRVVAAGSRAGEVRG